MDAIQAIILGIVEGITEFLPISSTGHMIIVADWLNMQQTPFVKAFEVIIQLAAILAVVANYQSKFTFAHRELWQKVLLAFLPIATVGFAFHKTIKTFFTSETVAIMFIVGGVLFLLLEFWFRKIQVQTTEVEHISYRQAWWIGIAQVFALIPGTSRAGASIVGAMLLKIDRKASAEFSFLLAIPVMCATTGLDLVKNYQLFTVDYLGYLLLGFVVAFITAFFTMKAFIQFLQSFTFVAFGLYRICFGAILLLFYL